MKNPRADEAATDLGDSPRGLQLRDDTKRILYELQVHEAELQAQNEELRLVQEALDTARAKYFDLYELAPVGYLTLNEPASSKRRIAPRPSSCGFRRPAWWGVR